MEKPREYTQEEVTEIFMEKMWSMIDYWENEKLNSDKDNVRYRISGFAHSFLAMLDGCSIDIPGFIIAPCPHSDDKRFHKQNGQNWFPENDVMLKSDLGGSLHEVMFKYENKTRSEREKRINEILPEPNMGK